ncbi:MAG TPA: anti-sigma factor [Bacteroidetes bacterium]|nr:anti-sigma factor [Bacteroidota bacterium]
MKSQAFITSGILEKYVLGMVTEEEAKEVQEMVSQHLEIKEELAAIRQTIRAYILNHQVAPEGGLKAKVMSVATVQTAPASRSANAPESTALPSYRAKKKKGESNLNLAGILAGLLGLALIVAGYMAFNNAEKAKTAAAKLAKSEEQVETLKQEKTAQEKTEQELRGNLGFYTDRNNKVLLLKGTNRAPGTTATIYWNDVEKKAFADATNLPSIAKDKVLVLWANVDRKAQKIGVLKNNAPGELSPLTYVQTSKLFFVTEEENPNVERPTRRRVLMTGAP